VLHADRQLKNGCESQWCYCTDKKHTNLTNHERKTLPYWTQNVCQNETLCINLSTAQKRLYPENDVYLEQNATDTCSVLGNGHSIIIFDNIV